MIILGQRSLPLSVHNRFVTTFTNTDVQTRAFPRQLVASDSQTHLVFIARANNQTTHSSGFHIPDLCRYPSPGIGHSTLHTIDPRSARSVCVHTAIVNISALVVVVLVDRLATFALDRHSSATMFGVFLLCVLCCLISWATHGLHADRAPVYRGCPCRDPLGCPLIPRQDGIRDKAPNLWLLL